MLRTWLILEMRSRRSLRRKMTGEATPHTRHSRPTLSRLAGFTEPSGNAWLNWATEDMSVICDYLVRCSYSVVMTSAAWASSVF